MKFDVSGCISFMLGNRSEMTAERALSLLSAVITPQWWSVSHLISEGLMDFVRNRCFIRRQPSNFSALRLFWFFVSQILFLSAPSALILLL